MSPSTELHVPDGYYPPFAAVTDTDHGAYIIIAVSLGTTLVLISSFIRAFIRISFAQRAGLDDAFLGAATVGHLAVGGVGSICVDMASRLLQSYSHASSLVHAHAAWVGQLFSFQKVRLTVFRRYIIRTYSSLQLVLTNFGSRTTPATCSSRSPLLCQGVAF